MAFTDGTGIHARHWHSLAALAFTGYTGIHWRHWHSLAALVAHFEVGDHEVSLLEHRIFFELQLTSQTHH